MKKLVLLSLVVLFTTLVSAQNLPLFELSRGSSTCPNVKTGPATTAIMPYVKSGQVALVIADFNQIPVVAKTDFLARYVQSGVFYQTVTEACHTGGLFNEVGNLYPDNVGGLYNMTLGIQTKAMKMIDSCNASKWNLNATYTVSDSVITVTSTGSASKVTSCNMIVVFTDSTHHFVGCLNGYLGKAVTVRRVNRTAKMSGSMPSNAKHVIVVLQDSKPYAKNIRLPELTQGNFERYVYCTAIAVRK